MAKIETNVFDAADFLDTPEDVASYISVWLEDGTPEEIRRALDTIARSRGMSELSRRTGISRAGLYKALGEGGNPSFETMRAILTAMGLRFAVAPLDDAA